MSQVLVLNTSLAGEDSVSRKLVADTVAAIVASQPALKVVERDLANNPIPHLTPETFAGVRAVAQTAPEKAAAALSDVLIGELQASDVIVIGAPMYNFSVPTTLRTWYDHVARPGVTFSYATGVPEGLIKGKRVFVVESRGGLYSEGPAQAVDFQEGYLRHILGFIGMTDATFIRAEKIGYGPDARAEAIEGARTAINDAVGAEFAKAAA